MLSVKKIYAGRGAADYYLAQERRGLADYYLPDGPGEGAEIERVRTAPGSSWWGGGASSLGLPVGQEGGIRREVFAPLYGRGIGPDDTPVGSSFRLPRDARDTSAARAAEVAAIDDPNERWQAERALARSQPRPSVAAWDCTFSPVKSVSLLWACGDPTIERLVWNAHLTAVDAGLDYLEQHASHVRAGRNGVRTLDATGLVVARMNEFTSRDGDPQLHTHCVIFNRARTIDDDTWRALDGRSLLAARTGAGAVYARTLEAALSRTFSLGWRDRPDGLREIDGIPDDLIDAFSKRSAAITTATERLRREWIADRGTEPTPAALRAMAQQATLATRRGKDELPVDVAQAAWPEQAAAAGHPLSTLLEIPTSRAQPSELFDAGQVGAVIARIVAGGRNSIGRHDVTRAAFDVITPGIDTPIRLRERAELLVEQVLSDRRLVTISVASPIDTPTERRRGSDGQSIYDRPNRQRWALRTTLDREAWLLDVTSRDRRAPTIAPADVAVAASRGRLDTEQAVAATRLVTSPDRVSLLVGPAGSGKTRTLRAGVDAWTSHGRPVIGLATSQAAADVLADATGARTENIAKWLHETRHGPWTMPAGALVIVDEASMVDTDHLVTLVDQTRAAGGRITLVGDPAQLSAVGAGGAFALLVDRGEPVELSEIRRFTHPWEAEATRRLRHGDPTILDDYERHGQLHHDDTGDVERTMVDAWHTDTQRPREVLMLAGTNRQADRLAAHARSLLVADGTVDDYGAGVGLRDDVRATVGDQILARRNDRSLVATVRSWVTNGSRWTIARTHPNGDATVRSATGASVMLPADYLAEHCHLGYATTIHRAQGLTVDTCHVLTDPTMDRNALYVALTRGREANHAWTDTTPGRTDLDPPTHQSLLATILARTSRHDAAVHDLIRDLTHDVTGRAALTDIFDDVALAATDIWLTDELQRRGMGQVTTDPAWHTFVCRIRQAAADGHRLPHLIDTILAGRDLRDVRSPARVLHWRLERHLDHQPPPPTIHRGSTVVGNGPDADIARQAEHALHATPPAAPIRTSRRHLDRTAPTHVVDALTDLRTAHRIPDHVDGLGPEPTPLRPDALARWHHTRRLVTPHLAHDPHSRQSAPQPPGRALSR